MKKLLLTLVLAAGFFAAQAQTHDFCMSDGFGYTADITATRTGPGYWTITGTGDALTAFDWTLSGYLNVATDQFYLNWINPSGPCDDLYVDNFEYISTGHSGGTIAFSWNNYYCEAYLSSGTGSTSYSPGACAFRTAQGTPGGPSVINPEPLVQSLPVTNMNMESLFEYLAEPAFSVARNDENNFTIGYEISGDANVTIDIYNHVGQYITTLVNGTHTEGFYKTNWNAADAVSGMYVAVLNVNGVTMSQKIMK